MCQARSWIRYLVICFAGELGFVEHLDRLITDGIHWRPNCSRRALLICQASLSARAR